MTALQKIYTLLSVLTLSTALFVVVLKPVLTAKYISLAKKYARGQYVCTLDHQGNHIGKLYKIKNNEKILIKTSVSNSCIFSKPKVNAGFFIFAIGGGGGATPYESGRSGKIISKHKNINKPIITIKIGKGGHGTYIAQDGTFIDAQDGYPTIIEELDIIAMGGTKSTRMTPLGYTPEKSSYHIPEKYHYLYNIPKSAKYGIGGLYNVHTAETSAKAESGHSGAAIIQW